MTSHRTSTGISLHYPYRESNPFSIPPSVELFGQRENALLQADSERHLIRSMTLIERADQLHPSIPNYISRSSQHRSEPRPPFISSTSSSTSPTRRDEKRRITEFIQEKREVFHLQLQIDRKQQEIKRIYNSITHSEHEFDRIQLELEQSALEFKQKSSELASRLTSAARAREIAGRKAISARQELKRVSTSVAVMKSEIAKNEALVELFSMMNEFLKQIIPEGMNRNEYFENPENLINEFDRLEQSNLRIYEYLLHYQELFDESLLILENKMTKNEKMTEEAAEKLKALREVSEEIGNAGTADLQELELGKLGVMIGKTYKLCIGKDADLSPLLQLERIEVRFDGMCERLKWIEPEFISERQGVRDKERREQQRLERQKKTIGQKRTIAEIRTEK
jgi:hypothetical protein